jgi:hypothetical protein
VIYEYYFSSSSVVMKFEFCRLRRSPFSGKSSEKSAREEVDYVRTREDEEVFEGRKLLKACQTTIIHL